MAELFDLLSGAGAKITFLEEEGHFRCASQDADTPGRIRRQGRRRGSSLDITKSTVLSAAVDCADGSGRDEDPHHQ